MIGCGAFGLFCLAQYRAVPDLELLAVADPSNRARREAKARFGVDAYAEPAELLSRDDIRLVHVATPPFTHRELVCAALAAGRHVLCEKPLAVNGAHAREMLALSAQRDRLLAVNLIMRYDPLCEAVKRIIEEGLLGAPLHAFFENYAKDEPLPAEHWFWDAERSGGIFIEHSVHFFDLFNWWLGPGTVVAAQQTKRPGSDLVEQVHGTVRHGNVLVNLYHGFHQASRMDRQEMRLVFERGDVSLYEWVPTRLRLDALVDETTLARLQELMPNCAVHTLEQYAGAARACTARHKRLEVDMRAEIAADVGMPKTDLYGHVLRGLMADQLAAIRDPAHVRRVTGQNGLTSLETAIAADRLARASP
ncbi:MAG: Gfo/Idh/MocA family oxidoreductase [Kiritimatiellae bacterium]|nr:Gfo/Idh/MocA family oxidoreductase [Kiritimatiellia bacterium]